MITFGGRPLNTYRGSKESNHIQVQPESVTIGPKSIINQKITIPSIPEPIIEANNGPVVVQVQPESISFEPPGTVTNPLIDKNNISANSGSATVPNSFTVGGTILSGKELLQLDKEIAKARFKNKIVVKIFGVEIVTTVMFIWWLVTNLFVLIILFVIFCICYYLHQITQGVLDAYHIVVDGITKLMEEINNVAIKFEVPGINKKIGPFNISMPPLLKVDFKLFGGMFDGPLRDMYRASKFTRDATELIIQTLIQMVTTIVDFLPTMIEGIANGASKIGDAI